MICIHLQGYNHFGKPPFQLCIRPESVFGGNATIKGHVFAVVEACQGILCGLQTAFPDEGIIQDSIISQRKPRLQSK